jgi:hypothetical protein
MFRSFALSVLLSLSTAVVHAGDCTGLDKMLRDKPHMDSKMGWLVDAAKLAFEKTPPPDSLCGSLSSVIKVAAGGSKQGGRRLEDDRPVSPAEVQADVDKAMANPRIRDLLDNTQASDEGTRLMYEAAIFDWGGYYKARDWRIAQLRQKAH